MDPHNWPHSEALVACATHQPLPRGFLAHEYRGEVVVPHPREAVYDWLCDPATFVRGQVFPYRVEFVDPTSGAPGGFTLGTPNVHHGPGLVVAGLVGAMRRPEYRDLRYFYGSHVLSLRLIRPTRLQFWLEEAEGGTTLRWSLESQVRKGFGGICTAVQGLFWRGFRTTVSSGVRKRLRKVTGG